MRIFLFGNPDLDMDALPIRLIPRLQKMFPSVAFISLDPNEEWDVPKHMVIIDTVVGSTEVTVFHDLHAFMQTPRVTCHDFDAYTNLQLLLRIGAIEGVTIIGLPPTLTEDTACSALDVHIKSLLKNNDTTSYQ